MGIVGDYPADLLTEACRKAMVTCTHPAKIVPFIAEECTSRIEHRRRVYNDCYAYLENIEAPRLAPKVEEVPDMEGVHELMAELLKEMQAKVRFSQ